MNPSDDTPDILVKWNEQGAPISVPFDDKYFCLENGYAEAVHVNCVGNSLRDRFLDLDPDSRGTFCVIETGFGTGLDFCCAWELWDECAPKSWTLHFISLELFPLSANEINRALKAWPRLSRYREALTAHYKPAPGEMKDYYFDDRRVRLTVAFDHVVSALRRIRDKELAPKGADAWFLDGFAPSKNPEMWSEEVFRAMAPLSRAGTTLATYTVAGSVRRGLEAQGFEVRKVPGYGKKNNILTGAFKGNKQ